MRLVTFELDSRTRAGAVVGEEIVDLGFDSVLELLDSGDDALDRAASAAQAGATRVPLAGVVLHPPVRPRKFMAIGLNYADHIAESGQPSPDHLTVFYKAPTSTTGPFDPIELPVVSAWLDYEGELGFVIGKRCRHVRAEDAADVIAGYVIVNDVSVRDWQIMTPQWSLGKSFDTHGPIGPHLVTADELGDPHDLGLRTYVNGDLRQESSTSNLIFTCFDIVEILSQAMTLEPGDVVATGTPSGIAAALPGRPWLVAGDRVRVEIDGLGAIENEVAPETVADDFAVEPAWLGGRSTRTGP
jgi:2-keto-4-pentenoate hydratase/2-oxohepta-3-ene-1,7-dioic acid hydratase in catechol pathway